MSLPLNPPHVPFQQQCTDTGITVFQNIVWSDRCDQMGTRTDMKKHKTKHESGLKEVVPVRSKCEWEEQKLQ